MKPISEFSEAMAREVDGLLFDLDDTLLTHGLLTRAAFDALWNLHDAKFKLVAVTGRPSGWGEVIARQWPIDGAVTENGAVHVVREGRGIRLSQRCDEDERRSRRSRLARIAEDVRTQVPESRLADDVGARVSDITWDIGERIQLPRDRVDVIDAIARKAGARTTRSSVHIHASFDADDKASGAVRFIVENLRGDSGSALARYAFVGDSSNDSACFAAFQSTFGVANVRAYAPRLPVTPKFVASKEMGEGFAEIANALLKGR
jgi:hydroxymethylpyrimidine pyrophosphatase-like HAD family hydrolase